MSFDLKKGVPIEEVGAQTITNENGNILVVKQKSANRYFIIPLFIRSLLTIKTPCYLICLKRNEKNYLLLDRHNYKEPLYF